MWDHVRNMKLSELEVREDLNFLEREWVIGRLASKAGVQEALSRPDDPRKLVVEYDADLVNTSDLVEFLQMCGLHADVTPLLRADRSGALT
jgi:hypothetical protein